MPGGQMAPSAFALSLNPTPDDVASIPAERGRADVLRAAKLNVWDEISVANGFHVSARFRRRLHGKYLQPGRATP